MQEMTKAYSSSEHEGAIYKKWEESGFLNPDNLEGEPYSIMMPPPNVTGVLHLGHALENSIMDIMARYQRMNGKKVLLLPGTDHAAVATQAKVEKILVEKGIKNPREELGRENLLHEIRNYAENSKATILNQIRKMGTSCDWSRLAYTFDEARNRAVNEVFVRMYQDGLIYRGFKVVNWSVKGQSTCSDDELEHVERKAKLYTFKYAKDFPIEIATTRPETKLGDTAVAVNPNDERYQKYLGKIFVIDVGAQNPLEIKIIADENVDPEFGTGALGVTPAHSIVDFEMYEKMKAKSDAIGLIPVIGTDGKMTKEAGKKYEGLTVIEAREKFVEWLKQEGLFIKEEEIIQNVGTSDRFKDVVEALPMTQWFVNVNKIIPTRDKSLKDLMREVIEKGLNNDEKQKINITPERFQKVYFNWINNLRDWCISRQIWWGHRIPVWYKKEQDKENKKTEDVYVGVEPPKGDAWIQDEDTLDTWFSSGLWTFSTIGWPNLESRDLSCFHPTNWMQMGYEILFFWMARMILMSTYALKEIPFKDVYIHGMLRDEKGNKFSKSAGNSIDPIEIIDKYGTDALRLSLLLGVTPGNDLKFYYEKIEGARNFVNKLWNIARYVLQNVEDNSRSSDIDFQDCTAADCWILNSMQNLIKEVRNDIEKYNFSQAGEKMRDFTWNDFADWYLEVSKFEKNNSKKNILIKILKDLLKLWHPFIPFVTEKIWESVDDNGLLLIEKYPQSHDYNISFSRVELKEEFELIKEIITSIRNARSENKVEPGKKIKALIFSPNNERLIQSNASLIKNMRTGIEELELVQKNVKIEGAIYIVIADVEICLIGAVDEEKEKARINKEVERLEKFITVLKNKLNNQEFIQKAPAKIIETEREKLIQAETELSSLKK